ncbi:MAG: 3-oxoacyl-ACP reductase FabG [Bacteroidota bacterium]
MKYALITGASRGIGKAIAIRLASSGYHILLNYQSNDQAADETVAVIQANGGSATKMKFDVSSEQETETAIQQWMDSTGVSYIEVLVNNAGIKKDNLMMWMTNDEWKSVLNTSLDGFFYITRFLLKPMLTKRYGRIINIVSLSGVKGMSGQTNYAAAKAAVIGATKSLAQEVAKRKITVNAVAPGFIKTDMTSDIDPDMYKRIIPMERFGEVEEVASLVNYLASKDASYITGEVIHVNGGLYT